MGEGSRGRRKSRRLRRGVIPPPVLDDGLARWRAFAEELPRLLDALWNAPSYPRLKHPAVPRTAGLYVFVENGRPMYVGQTRNLGRRLGEHCRAASRENQASFAFNLARESAKLAGVAMVGYRKALAADPAFAEHFKAAKVRVATMEVRFIELDNPELRTVFEVYGSLALGTEAYNSFETH